MRTLEKTRSVWASHSEVCIGSAFCLLSQEEILLSQEDKTSWYLKEGHTEPEGSVSSSAKYPGVRRLVTSAL